MDFILKVITAEISFINLVVYKMKFLHPKSTEYMSEQPGRLTQICRMVCLLSYKEGYFNILAFE